MTISGTSLLDGGDKGIVTFNGTPATVLSHSATSILVDVPAGATTGAISVHVNGDTIESPSFTVVPVPQISGINPNYGAPAALIKIAGTNFGATQGNGSVTVGGALSRVVSWSNTLISITVPSNATTGDIVVTTGGGSSSGEAFTFYPYPAITGVAPASGSMGTPVTISGTSLLDGEDQGVVTFNGTPATIISQSNTDIQVNVPAGSTSGPIIVRVNGDTVKSSTSFTVTNPQLSSISPNYGAPAAPITITGINFGATQGNSLVTVGGAPSYVASWSSTAISILVPSRATTGNIVVTVGGVFSNGEPFTFYSYPAITGISPFSGPVGTPVTITGNHLLDGGNKATVTFNGTPAAVLSDTSTSIMVNVPTGATTGPVNVRVNGIPLKTQEPSPSPASQLNISSISPNYGAPAALIIIAGTGFGATQGSSVVTVGGEPSYVASWSNSAISILVPTRATTGDIVVTVGGVSSNGEPFTFYPYPAITEDLAPQRLGRNAGDHHRQPPCSTAATMPSSLSTELPPQFSATPPPASWLTSPPAPPPGPSTSASTASQSAPEPSPSRRAPTNAPTPCWRR